MPYDSRGYFYYAVREGTKIRRLYFGRGPLSELAAHLVEQIRLQLAIKKRRSRQRNQVNQQIEWTEQELDLFIQAALLSIGYHRHDRGPWRKWREPRATNPEDQGLGESGSSRRPAGPPGTARPGREPDGP